MPCNPEDKNELHSENEILLSPYNPSRAIAALYRSNMTILRTLLQERGVDMSDADYLLALSLHEGITQQDLSKELFVSQAAIVRTTKKLCEKGLVKREQDGLDKRVNRLFLTEKGASLMPIIEEVFGQLIDLYCETFSEEEQRAFKRLTLKALKQVRAFIEQ